MTNETEASELLPCPFCGGENVCLDDYHHTKGVAVRCPDCRMDSVRYWSDSHNSIAAAWNVRADLSDAKIVEAAIATIKANVPPLEWSDPVADWCQHQMGGDYEVTNAGHLYFHRITHGDISTDLIARFDTIEAAKAAANTHHVAQLMKGLGIE